MIEQSRDEYCIQLQGMDDTDLRKECNVYIWLSAYASNNPTSAYHWKCDMALEECKRRGKEAIYTSEHRKLMGNT
jgi:hypothetical protein